MKLEGKVAIVTGAGQGIGKKIALTLAQEGAGIVANDIAASNVESTVSEVKAMGQKAVPAVADVSRSEEVKRIVGAALENFGKIDILVNNAIRRSKAPFLEMTEEGWDSVLAVGLKGTFLCCQEVARHMVERRYGKIINISSVNGLGALSPLQVNYSCAKAGVNELTQFCAAVLGEYNINVNAIAPGTIETDSVFILRKEAAPDFLKERRGRAVLGRTGTPQDIANLALFLATDEASFITGQIIVADGGRHDRMYSVYG